MSFVFRGKFIPFIIFSGLIFSFGSCVSKEKIKTSKKASLIYFSDLHGHFTEHPELFWETEQSFKTEIAMAGGLSRIAASVNKIRKENPEGVLFMDAGDTIQGAAEVALSEGAVAIPLLNAMKIDLAIPGNWEVVYGTKVFKNFTKQVNYPFIASNILDQKTNKLVFKPYDIKNLNGIRVAIIGFTDPDVPTRQPPSFSEGFIYKDDSVLQPLVDEIKNQNKADVIVLLTHIGLPKAVHLATKLKNVDVILSSDTHERTYEPIIRGETWIVEPGAFGSFIGRLDLELNSEGKLKKDWKLIELRADKFTQNKEIESLVQKTLSPYQTSLSKKIGETKVPLIRYNVLQTTMDAVLSDALRDATGTEIALSNGFRFAYPIVPGPLKEKDLWSVYPINTEIKTGKLTGKQLKDFFEREIENVFSDDPEKLFGGWLPRPSGMYLEFDLSLPVMKRVTKITVNNKPLEEKRVYTVTTCVREGDPETTLCRIPNGKDIEVKDFDAHEAVRRYLKKNWPITEAKKNRVKAHGLSENVRSQFYRK